MGSRAAREPAELLRAQAEVARRQLAALLATWRTEWVRPLRRYTRGFRRGVLLGVCLGILYAPRSGRQTRRLAAGALLAGRRLRAMRRRRAQPPAG